MSSSNSSGFSNPWDGGLALLPRITLNELHQFLNGFKEEMNGLRGVKSGVFQDGNLLRGTIILCQKTGMILLDNGLGQRINQHPQVNGRGQRHLPHRLRKLMGMRKMRKMRNCLMEEFK